MADDLLEDSGLDEMDDEFEDEEQEGQESGGFSIKVAIPVFLVQAVVAYFVASFFLVPMLLSNTEAEPENETTISDSLSAEEDSLMHSFDEIGPIFNVEDIIVNPAESGGERLIVLNLALELNSEDVMAECQKREPLIRDIAIGILSSLPIDSLSGSGNMEKLKAQFNSDLKRVLPPHAIKRIYFTNFIIQ